MSLDASKKKAGDAIDQVKDKIHKISLMVCFKLNNYLSLRNLQDKYLDLSSIKFKFYKN